LLLNVIDYEQKLNIDYTTIVCLYSWLISPSSSSSDTNVGS